MWASGNVALFHICQIWTGERSWTRNWHHSWTFPNLSQRLHSFRSRAFSAGCFSHTQGPHTLWKAHPSGLLSSDSPSLLSSATHLISKISLIVLVNLQPGEALVQLLGLSTLAGPPNQDTSHSCYSRDRVSGGTLLYELSLSSWNRSHFVTPRSPLNPPRPSSMKQSWQSSPSQHDHTPQRWTSHSLMVDEINRALNASRSREIMQSKTQTLALSEAAVSKALPTSDHTPQSPWPEGHRLFSCQIKFICWPKAHSWAILIYSSRDEGYVCVHTHTYSP